MFTLLTCDINPAQQLSMLQYYYTVFTLLTFNTNATKHTCLLMLHYNFTLNWLYCVYFTDLWDQCYATYMLFNVVLELLSTYCAVFSLLTCNTNTTQHTCLSMLHYNLILNLLQWLLNWLVISTLRNILAYQCSSITLLSTCCTVCT